MEEDGDTLISSVLEEDAEHTDSDSLCLDEQPGSIKKKKYKKGIVYLSFIPPFMSVGKIMQLMSQCGKVGRIYLQPADAKDAKKKKKRKNMFTEGWVEFLKKKVAKQVAANLNNQQIGGKKSNKYHDYLWNIKYLPRFKWIHLSERLSYERAVFKQRMQTEISQAKKMANHFIYNVELAERKKKKNPSMLRENGDPVEDDAISSPQETNDEDTWEQRRFKKKESREDFLKSLFS